MPHKTKKQIKIVDFIHKFHDELNNDQLNALSNPESINTKSLKWAIVDMTLFNMYESSIENCIDNMNTRTPQSEEISILECAYEFLEDENKDLKERVKYLESKIEKIVDGNGLNKKELIDLAKEQDFEYCVDYFDYIVNSYFNGQRKQCIELFEAMKPEDKQEFFTSYLNDQQSEETTNLLKELLTDV